MLLHDALVVDRGEVRLRRRGDIPPGQAMKREAVLDFFFQLWFKSHFELKSDAPEYDLGLPYRLPVSEFEKRFEFFLRDYKTESQKLLLDEPVLEISFQGNNNCTKRWLKAKLLKKGLVQPKTVSGQNRKRKFTNLGRNTQTTFLVGARIRERRLP